MITIQRKDLRQSKQCSHDLLDCHFDFDGNGDGEGDKENSVFFFSGLT